MVDWVIKSISITPADAAVARKVGNLSKFVRICLRRWEVHETTQNLNHKQPGVHDRLGFCSPSTHCVLCWPDGVPKDHDWRIYRGKSPMTTTGSTEVAYHGPEVGDKEWLLSTVDPPFSIEKIDARGNEPKAQHGRSLRSRIISAIGQFRHK